jgi:glycosyltransferase involved in cell wall biosynthesis
MLMTRRSLRKLSVVIPGFNEADSLPLLYAALDESLGNKSWELEIVFVDDGSVDNTLQICEELHQKDARFSFVSLSRNFGHQRALTAGLDYCTGQVVVIMDADLQDPPEVVNQMLTLWRDGADVVYGKRRSRDSDSHFKKITAALFYKLIRALSGINIPADTGDFRIMDKRVVEALGQMPEQGRFLRGMIPWVGFRQEPFLYDRKPRVAGHTRYPLVKMLRFAWDGISSFTAAPLRIATWVGALSFIAALVVGCTYAIARILYPEMFVPGWTALFLAIMAFGGLQMMSIGILGEYLAKCFEETKRRPLYFIKKSSFDGAGQIK